MATGERIHKKWPNPAPTPRVRPFGLKTPGEVPKLQAQVRETLGKGSVFSYDTGDRLSRIDFSAQLPIQPKLMTGSPQDKSEQEADCQEAKVSQKIGSLGDSIQGKLFSSPQIQRKSQPHQQSFTPVSLQTKPLTIQRDSGDRTDSQPQIKSEDIEYEIIGHRFAYQGDTLPAAAGDWLATRGYQRNWTLTIRGEGFFMGLLMPVEKGGRTPILAFKGTSPDDVSDLLADLDPIAIGFTAFKRQQKKVAEAIATAGGKVDVVGHSLGGALAQHAASAFPNKVRRVVTFQAPAINRIQSYMFGKLDASERPEEVRHHIATGDIVDVAGGKHLAGEVLLHQVGSSPTSHIQYLLNSDAFKDQRDALGLTDEMLEELGVAEHKANHQGKVEKFEEYPYWFRQILTEWGGRTLLGAVPGAVLSAYRGAKKIGSGVAAGASYVGDKIASGASSIATGASYVGDKIATGASYVGDKIASGASSIYDSTRNLWKNLF